jgi:hypothetical protein
LRWLAELRPGGGLRVAELADRLGDDLLGAATLLLAMPTWRANDPEELGRVADDLAQRVPRVVVALVEVHTFEVGGRVPHLDPGRVDALEDELRGAGALVVRLGAGSDLAAAFGRAPAEVAP